MIADVLMDVRIGHDFTEIGDCAVLFKLFVIKEQSPVSRILFVCKKTPEHDDLHGNKKKEEIALSVFENADEKKIFEHTEDGIYSLYGYSGEMDKYISVGNKKININVVFSYDETNNVTQIMIGSPVVNYDY